PVLRRHGAPATLFVTTGFADGTGDLWWLALERALANADSVMFGGETIDVSTTERKFQAWDRLYWQLRAMNEGEMRAQIAQLAERAGVNASRSAAHDLCMGWDELREVAKDPLV